MANMNLRHPENRLSDRAFTLIELLTVIAIIGIITAMIVNLAPAMNQRKKIQRLNIEKQNLALMIESYKAKFGHYPPDNANLATMTQPLDVDAYDVNTQVNPLYYELGGGSNNVDGSHFVSFDSSNIPQSDITKAFGVQGILNADQETQVVYRAPANAHLNYPGWMIPGGITDVAGLTVPLDTVQQSKNSPNKGTPTSANFWHYDASSIFRHNQNSFDLWAVYAVKRLPGSSSSTIPLWQFATNSNW